MFVKYHSIYIIKKIKSKYIKNKFVNKLNIIIFIIFDDNIIIL